MCGISGILPFEGPKDSIKIEEMVQSISHRGPDQKIIFVTMIFHLANYFNLEIDLGLNLFILEKK